MCSQLAESSAKEVAEESSAGEKNKSSKSVLVVGATGGVGAYSFLDELESFCVHTNVGLSCSDDDSRSMWEDVNCMILIAKFLRIFVAGVCVCVCVWGGSEIDTRAASSGIIDGKRPFSASYYSEPRERKGAFWRPRSSTVSGLPLGPTAVYISFLNSYLSLFLRRCLATERSTQTVRRRS